MDDKIKLIIEVPRRYYEILKCEVENHLTDYELFKIIGNGLPLDSNLKQDETKAYFDGMAYGWEEGRKALVNDAKEVLEKQIKRDLAYAENETLKVPLHYGIANGYQNAIALLNNINGESEDTE